MRLSEGSALVAPLTKMEQVSALSSEQDVLNWWDSAEYSGLVAAAGVNYASVVYLPTIFIHSFIYFSKYWVPITCQRGSKTEWNTKEPESALRAAMAVGDTSINE